jgi:hypothetical protein
VIRVSKLLVINAEHIQKANGTFKYPFSFFLSFYFCDSVVAKFSGNIPKGPTCITLWCKDPSLSVEDQNEYLEESSNLITASFESLQTETCEIYEGQLVQYLKLDLRLANRTIQKYLSKLGYARYNVNNVLYKKYFKPYHSAAHIEYVLSKHFEAFCKCIFVLL